MFGRLAGLSHPPVHAPAPSPWLVAPWQG